MRTAAHLATVALATLLVCSQACAQHLWWRHDGQSKATCLYGEITVLATEQTIYYCGANWHPGQPAGGYCGIQHNSGAEKRTIFSIWDTSAALHPSVSFIDPEAVGNRFGGEGEGGHTHMLWNWDLDQKFQFFVHKHPSKTAKATDADYFIFDRPHNKWRHISTITSPNGDSAKELRSVPNLGGGGIASFLENFSGQRKETAKLAIYNLWLGDSPKELKRLTVAKGDGKWGELGDAYFLAEGTEDNLAKVYQRVARRFGKPISPQVDHPLPALKDRGLPRNLTHALEALVATQ